jgi:TRAP-type C4-dicarboxylate transport system permease large subunit
MNIISIDPGLITIPLFLLMGNLLIHSGISDHLFKALNVWLAGIRGGLAIVSFKIKLNIIGGIFARLEVGIQS